MISTTAFLEKTELSPNSSISATAFLIGRIPGLTFTTDRKAAFLDQLPLHRALVEELFPSPSPNIKTPFVYAEQCHSANLALVSSPFIETELPRELAVDHKEQGTSVHKSIVYRKILEDASIGGMLPLASRVELYRKFTKPIAQVDGLITTDVDVVLGITVADCAPVWIVEKKGKAGALIHSGKRGTDLEIVPKAITFFKKELQIAPSELVLTIGPCIRPPCYEVDFAKIIREQAATVGVSSINDQQICTACHLDRYYSYRREKGSTGHMLALLKLNSIAAAE